MKAELTFPEFQAILRSREKALDKIWLDYVDTDRDFLPNRLKLPASGKGISEDAIFWAISKDESALKAPFFRSIILKHLDSGDVDFFIKLGGDLKRKPRSLNEIQWVMYAFWVDSPLGAGLCFCSDKVITDFLKIHFGASITEAQVRKTRQRLGLKKPRSIVWRHLKENPDGTLQLSKVDKAKS